MKMECCLVSGGAYRETADIHDVKIQTARNAHKCGECHEPIRPGEKYERVRSMADGWFATHKTCSACVRVRDSYFCEGWHYGYVWPDLIDALRDVYYDVPESEWAGMLPVFWRGAATARRLT